MGAYETNGRVAGIALLVILAFTLFAVGFNSLQKQRSEFELRQFGKAVDEAYKAAARDCWNSAEYKEYRKKSAAAGKACRLRYESAPLFNRKASCPERLSLGESPCKKYGPPRPFKSELPHREISDSLLLRP